ncbi:MAG: N-formylglutamate amidohydrolase [Planctomycetota bacterium]
MSRASSPAPGRVALLLTAEHASRAVPPGVELGVDEAALASHRGWDPGSLVVGQDVAERLGEPLLAGRWTRLWVDLNRREENPEVIPTASFSVAVPGNRDLPPAAREARLAAHRAHRAEARARLDAALARAARCLHLAFHSFTPELPGRELEVGVLFDPDRAWEAERAEALLAALRARGWDARANQPYLGVDDGLTTWLRERYPAARYAGIELEANQGLPPARLAALAEDLAAALSSSAREGRAAPG